MFRLRTLGGLTLERGGQPHGGPATQRRRLALLALTASADARGIAREKLAAYLWPESEPARARHSLDDALSALRRELGGEALFLGVASLRLNPEVLSSDLAEFNVALRGGDLERAVALYGGPFLDGFNVGGAPEFERWVDAERSRLARDYESALERLAAAASASGDAPAAAAWWRRRVAADPLSTRATLELIGSLSAAGERGEALRVAQVHEALVREELGAEPDPRLTAAVEALRAAPTHAPTTSGTAIAMTTAPSAAPAFTPVSDAPPASTPPAPRASLGVERRDSGWHGTRGLWRRRHGSQLIGIAALVTLLAAAVYASRRGQGGAAVDETLDPHRVAVIPFENATGDPRFDALGAMVADVTSQAIVQSGFLRVVSSPSALVPLAPARTATTTGIRESAAQFGRRLEAGTVVSGAIYGQGDSLRFQAQLTDVAKGEVASVLVPVAGLADAPSGAVHEVADRTLAGLAALFDERLASWARVAGPPPSYAAYREFVAGRAAWPDYRRALVHFQRAAALDTTYDLALLQMAVAHRMLGACDKTDSLTRIVLSRGRQLAQFDRLYMEKMVAMCNGDIPGAYQRALEMRRLAPTSLWVAYDILQYEADMNRPLAALAAVEAFDLERGAAEVGPTFYLNLALTLHLIGRHERELEVANLGRRVLPTATQVMRARLLALAALGRTREVLIGLDALIVLGRPGTEWRTQPMRVNLVAQDLRFHGHREAANAVLQRSFALLEARPSDERATPGHLFELGTTQYAAERWADAAATFRMLVALDSANIDYRGSLGVASARIGDRATAAAQADWLARVNRPFEHRPVAWQMRIAALLGERERAVKLAEQALARDGYGTLGVHWRLDLDSLRGYPPFEELLRPKG